MTNSESFDVLIIGGGAAGMLVATRLLADPQSRLQIGIVDPSEELARGVAYATEYPEHLLNVIASRMSAFDEDPYHFVRFLVRECTDVEPAVLAEVFASRRDYGRYLSQTLKSQSRYAALSHFRDRCVNVDRDREDNIVTLASGCVLRTRCLVLALGNAARKLQVSPQVERLHVVNSWDYSAVRDIDPKADVAVIGSGLSMVDTVLSLAHCSHQGHVRVLSRHGLMPLVHARPGPRSDSHSDGVDDLLTMPILRRFRAMRQRVAEAMAAGEPWQWTFDRLRPHVTTLWQSMDTPEQRRFLRHVARRWDIHRHRIAPQAGAVLSRLNQSGQLRVEAARELSIQPDSLHGVALHYRTGRVRNACLYRARCVINATGVESHIDRRAEPLIVALRGKGRIQPGPHGIGIASVGKGHVLDVQGRPDPQLMVIGALRIGDLWESLAIPELRVQAKEIAEVLRDHALGTKP